MGMPQRRPSMDLKDELSKFPPDYKQLPTASDDEGARVGAGGQNKHAAVLKTRNH